MTGIEASPYLPPATAFIAVFAVILNGFFWGIVKFDLGHRVSEPVADRFAYLRSSAFICG